MSLRLRLTLLYSTLLGAVLLFFGVLVYSLVSVINLNQIDQNLSSYSSQLIGLLKVSSSGQFDPRSVSTFQPTDNLLFQVWGTDNRLQISRPSGLSKPLDINSRDIQESTFSSVTTNDEHLRVLSIPLQTFQGSAGTLQVALNLNLLDAMQASLAKLLGILTIASMVVAFAATWRLTSQALAPLATVTSLALQITRADDLQRRIPLPQRADDEVSKLICAFNQTLSRLEDLFFAQRRFLSDISHELRTPLTVIKGNIGLIRKFGAADEESLDGIESEVDRLSRLVGDVLLLGQVEAGQLPLHMAVAELDTILLEVYNQMRTIAGDRIKVHLADIDQIFVLGDRDRLKQVLINLVANAIQYTPAGGQVSLQLDRVGSQARLSVQDTGAGIPLEDLPHIFERFYRSEKSRTRHAGTGFGLGLSIAAWIIEKHNGHIDVESELGKGTTFTVWLPLHHPKI